MNRETYGVNPLAPGAPARPTPRDAPPPGVGAMDRPVAYDGEAGALFRIVFRNTLLGLLTFGFYRFWGKTRLRRYLWAQLRLFGDRLEYTGTAMELFLGFLIALAVLVPVVVAFKIVELLTGPVGLVTQVAVQAVYFALLGFLIGVAVFRARRYRLTRTAWRGIRLGQSGASVRYALLWMGYTLLTIVTLGLARPVGEVGLQRFLVTNTWLGSVRFEFEGRARDLFWRWLPCLILVPFTLGLSLMWYAALRVRYFATCTRFSTLGFALPVTFRAFARIFVPYYLALGLMFGAFGMWLWLSGAFAGDPQSQAMAPFGLLFIFLLFVPALQIVMITHRMMRLIADQLFVTGDADLERIVQHAQAAPKTGEGLADALDVGGGLEVGF